MALSSSVSCGFRNRKKSAFARHYSVNASNFCAVCLIKRSPIFLAANSSMRGWIFVTVGCRNVPLSVDNIESWYTFPTHNI